MLFITAWTHTNTHTHTYLVTSFPTLQNNKKKSQHHVCHLTTCWLSFTVIQYLIAAAALVIDYVASYTYWNKFFRFLLMTNNDSAVCNNPYVHDGRPVFYWWMCAWTTSAAATPHHSEINKHCWWFHSWHLALKLHLPRSPRGFRQSCSALTQNMTNSWGLHPGAVY